MAQIEDDFAAYTTIGDRVAPPSSSTTKGASSSSSAPSGPKFGVPSKLEPFTLLAKSARGAGAANLISQVVSAPGVYVFSELLELPSIKELAANEQHSKQYKLLELFAYGTWNDYNAARDEYPTLTTEQSFKLKQLTILSLASETRILPYATLLESLEIPSIPLLEDLLIESIYSNIFVARLDQKSRQLEILSSLGRDVKPISTTPVSSTPTDTPPSMELDSNNVNGKTISTAPSIGTLLNSLQEWQTKIDGLLNSLDQHLATLNANSVNQSKKSLEHEQRVKEMVVSVAAGSKGGKSRTSAVVTRGESSAGGGGGATSGPSAGLADDGEMDVDQFLPAPAAGTTRSAMSPGGSTAGQRQRKRGRI